MLRLLAFLGVFSFAEVARADTLVVLNKAEANASLIDPASGTVRATVATGIGPHEVVIGPDGRTAVVSNYGDETPGSSLTVFDIGKAEVLRTIDLGALRRPHGLAWVPGSRIVVVTVEDAQGIVCVDVDSGRVHKLIATGQQVSHMVALDPDGKRAFVANIVSGTVSVLELRTGKQLATITTGAGAEGIAMRPDGRELWVGNREADTVSVIDTTTLEVRETIAAKAFPIRAAMLPDGKRALVSSAKAATLGVFDTEAHRELHTIRFAKLPGTDKPESFGNQFGDSAVPIGIVIDPSGKRAFVALARADVIAVVDLAKRKVTKTLKAGKAPDGLAYTRVDVAR
ncbi:MAG TPA: cytochrome D1 domain-containing protein [Nannocystaceae bacterium]|nr:cytochrome D1 domain-containing protein [Nannocystaceae bacterium]